MVKKYLKNFTMKLQVLLHLDTRYFLKNSFLNGIQQTVGVIAGLIISYLFGHYTSKQTFGDYNLILSVLGFLTIITLPGLDEYLTRSVAQGNDSSYIRGVKVKFYLSLLGIPILAGFALYYLINKQPSLGNAFLITAILFPLFHPFQLFNEFMTAKMNFKSLTKLLSFSSLLTLFFISIAIITKQPLSFIIAGYMLGIIVPSLIGHYQSIKKSSKSKKRDKELIRYAIFMTFMTLPSWSSAYLGMIVLGTYLGSELLAVFVVANKIPTYVQKNLFVFHKSLTAKLAKQTNKQHIDTIRIHSLKLIVWGMLLGLSVYIASPYFIRFIFTNTYNDAILYAQLLSLAVIPLPFSWVLSDILLFQKIKKPRVYSTLFINIAKIVSYIVIIPLYKLLGLVVIYIVERYVILLVNLFIIFNENKKNRMI